MTSYLIYSFLPTNPWCSVEQGINLAWPKQFLSYVFDRYNFSDPLALYLHDYVHVYNSIISNAQHIGIILIPFSQLKKKV